MKWAKEGKRIKSSEVDSMAAQISAGSHQNYSFTGTYSGALIITSSSCDNSSLFTGVH